jgi:hypothetical protein
MFDYSVNGGAFNNMFYITSDGGILASSTIASLANSRVGASSIIYWNTRVIMSSPADSVMLLQNQAQTDFNRLQFGGTSASFPALKRNGTSLVVKLADDSASAPLIASQLTGTNGIATYSVTATNAIAATGITNTSLFNRHAMLTVTAVAFAIKNYEGTIIYNSPAALTATMSVPLQPGGAITAASGLSGTLLPY